MRYFGSRTARKVDKLSTDPLFIEKVRDVIGLYLNPPQNTLVLERTQTMLPMGLDYAEGVTHDYTRHGP